LKRLPGLASSAPLPSFTNGGFRGGGVAEVVTTDDACPLSLAVVPLVTTAGEAGEVELLLLPPPPPPSGSTAATVGTQIPRLDSSKDVASPTDALPRSSSAHRWTCRCHARYKTASY
jgi:hypothetical protein